MIGLRNADKYFVFNLNHLLNYLGKLYGGFSDVHLYSAVGIKSYHFARNAH